jgi:hypothetical protein
MHICVNISYIHIFLVNQMRVNGQPPSGRLITLNPSIVSRGMNIRSGYDNAPARTTMHKLTSHLIHHHGVLHNISSGQGIYFIVKEVCECLVLSHNYYPEVGGLLEKWNSLLKIQLRELRDKSV